MEPSVGHILALVINQTASLVCFCETPVAIRVFKNIYFDDEFHQ